MDCCCSSFANYLSYCTAGVLRLGEGTPSYDSEMDVEEQMPWEHITGAGLCKCMVPLFLDLVM